jgi:phosphoribosylamine--glycine ligase
MKVLVVGAGGREHALCWALGASPLVDRLYCAPGSDAIAREATCVPLAVDDVASIVAFCREEGIELVVPGPELPLVLGLVDRLEAAGIPAFGPRAAAARLEGSKAFAKEFCVRHGIPTAPFRIFTREQADAAKAHVRAHGAPVVIKADGLAAGKGVTVAGSVEEALAALDAAFAGAFGAAGATVVVEDCLTGEEASLFALVDGASVLEFGTAQDHKRVGEGDTGPNTGGMGAYSPAPVLTPELERQAMEDIIGPTVRALAAVGTPYSGILFAGLMLTAEGPKLIEYNVRFGDPECQAIMPRIGGDFAGLLRAVASGADFSGPPLSPDASLTVVVAARGYPSAPATGASISGIARAEAIDGVTVFQAGTAIAGGKLVASGGRVLAVTAVAETLAEAANRAYRAVDAIDFADGFCRRDIGWRELERQA